MTKEGQTHFTLCGVNYFNFRIMIWRMNSFEASCFNVVHWCSLHSGLGFCPYETSNKLENIGDILSKWDRLRLWWVQKDCKLNIRYFILKQNFILLGLGSSGLFEQEIALQKNKRKTGYYVQLQRERYGTLINNCNNLNNSRKMENYLIIPDQWCCSLLLSCLWQDWRFCFSQIITKSLSRT